MKAISLEDVIPAEPEFYLKKMDRVFKIRPPNMLDNVWLKERYDDKRLQEILAKMDWIEICKIVYHQLEKEDRAVFPATTAQDLDDDGFTTEVKLTGPQHLLVHLSGLEESLKMLSALTRAIMISNPVAAEVVEAEVKKNLKANLASLNQQTGRKSSSNSTTPSGGRKNTSRR